MSDKGKQLIRDVKAELEKDESLAPVTYTFVLSFIRVHLQEAHAAVVAKFGPRKDCPLRIEYDAELVLEMVELIKPHCRRK